MTPAGAETQVLSEQNRSHIWFPAQRWKPHFHHVCGSFVLHQDEMQPALPGGSVCGTVNYILKLGLIWCREQRWVWREAPIGVYKYLRHASTGLPSGKMWWGASAALSGPLTTLLLQAAGQTESWLASGTLTSAISLEIEIMTLADANVCHSLERKVVRNVEKCVCINKWGC